MDVNNNESNGFAYTYSAKEQAELKRIREKYTPTTEAEDKMTRLRRLDASVTQSAQIVALIFGIIGTLILGFGMSLCMTNIGATLEIEKSASMAIGISVGIIGAILLSFAYPMYNFIIKHRRARIAPEIIRLTDELMK